MKFGNQDISNTTTARSFKLGQLIEMRLMRRLPCENLNIYIFFESLPFANVGMYNLH